MTLLEQLQAAAENARKAYSIRAISCRRNA